MSKKWQRGEIATIITIGTLVILGLSTLVSAVFLNSQKKQVTSSKAAELVTCRDNPDLSRTPAGYYWKADCNKTCVTNGNCPQNESDPSNVDKNSSNWCYGFDGPNKSTADWRCLMLQHGSAPNQGNPTSTPVPPNNGGNGGGGTSSTKPGDKCRYSQMNGSAVVCYEGNVKPDGNCGYVPGVSTGTEISCSGNYSPTGGNNPAPTQAPQPGGSNDEGSACSEKGQVVNSCAREDCDTGIKHWVQIEKYCTNNGIIEYRSGIDTGRSCNGGGSQACPVVQQPTPTSGTGNTGGGTGTGGQNSAPTSTPAPSSNGCLPKAYTCDENSNKYYIKIGSNDHFLDAACKYPIIYFDRYCGNSTTSPSLSPSSSPDQGTVSPSPNASCEIDYCNLSTRSGKIFYKKSTGVGAMYDYFTNEQDCKGSGNKITDLPAYCGNSTGQSIDWMNYKGAMTVLVPFQNKEAFDYLSKSDQFILGFFTSVIRERFNNLVKTKPCGWLNLWDCGAKGLSNQSIDRDGVHLTYGDLQMYYDENQQIKSVEYYYGPTVLGVPIFGRNYIVSFDYPGDYNERKHSLQSDPVNLRNIIEVVKYSWAKETGVTYMNNGKIENIVPASNAFVQVNGGQILGYLETYPGTSIVNNQFDPNGTLTVIYKMGNLPNNVDLNISYNCVDLTGIPRNRFKHVSTPTGEGTIIENGPILLDCGPTMQPR